jgi:hypothetical protein
MTRVTTKRTGTDVKSGASRKKKARTRMYPRFIRRMRNMLSHMSKNAFFMRKPNISRLYHSFQAGSNRAPGNGTVLVDANDAEYVVDLDIGGA